jgi:acetyltransferase-like isoleucine patch superfamily enzyme
VRTALIGYGSHGCDIEAIFKLYGHGDLLIFDEDPTVAAPPPNPMTIPHYLGDYYDRRQMAERIGGSGAPPLHDVRLGARDCVFGPGVVIAPGVTLLHQVTLGMHTHVNYGCCLTRTWVGDFVTLSPGVTICGDVEIGDDSFIGAGAVVSDRVTIGKRAKIGAGAVLPPLTKVGDDEVWVGVPARKVDP